MADLIIELTVGKTLASGLWCGPCALPSGLEVELLQLAPCGIHPFGTLRVCVDCGQRIARSAD